MSKIVSGFANGLAVLALSVSAVFAEADDHGHGHEHEIEMGPSGLSCEEAGVSKYFCEWATDGDDTVLPERYNDAVFFSDHCSQFGSKEGECAAFSFQLLGVVPVDPAAE
ncbi:MAG: hypothetical protein AB8B83_02530 [Bdellovibrionales bacterium]